MAEWEYGQEQEQPSADQLRRELGERQAAFVEALLSNGGNATQAALAAGYSEKTAASQASRLLKNAKVAAYRRARARETYEAIGVTAESLALELEEIKRRCMMGREHLSWDPVAKEWVPDGTWLFDAKGAINAIRTQAELMGLDAPKKVEGSLKVRSIEDFLASLPDGRQF